MNLIWKRGIRGCKSLLLVLLKLLTIFIIVIRIIIFIIIIIIITIRKFNWSMHFLKDVWTSLHFKHAILAQYVVQHAKQKQLCFQELLKVLGISPRTLECLKFLRARKKFKRMAYRKRRKKISTFALNMMKLWKFIATQITASFASTVR